MREYLIYSVNDISDASFWILSQSGGKKQFAFYGEMGAGKTTIIKSICQILGTKDNVSSPTFSIINEYSTEFGDFLYHFDFYRIEKREEVFEFGFEEYLDSDSYCFLEWPEKVEEILPHDIIKIYINVSEDGVRRLSLNIN